ncbi:hypothetical protein G7Y89_g881 [Cudoniella acicularis]|uniref:RNA polymerase II assembly factor Rtp1 C-terminal domain-containing protein n=1 Tax=Cudoniella acicularis TaxID=354080 RepID=A0A8H4WAT2_9HELO|nr:hypothetical protein G7Y89_g881 [Cudoniella acicularis]
MEPAKKENQPPLVDNILRLGTLAFDPKLPEESRQQNQEEFNALLNRYHNQTISEKSANFFQHEKLSTHASLEPLGSARSRRATGGNEKRSGISHEALSAISKLLSSPPLGMAPEKWFSGIASQLFSLLQGEGEPEMEKAAAFVIGFGILGRKQYGAPGMPGWGAFVEPIMRCIDPASVENTSWQTPSKEEILTLGSPKILVQPTELAKALRNLSTLLTSHPHPSLSKRLLRPILLPLWSLASWPQDTEAIENMFRKPAREMLKILIQLSPSGKDSLAKNGQTSSTDILSIILQNLTFTGRSESDKKYWRYITNKDGGIQIQEQNPDEINSTDRKLDLAVIDNATDKFISFMGLFENTPDFNVEISILFMALCSKWLFRKEPRERETVLTRLESKEDDIGKFESRLIEAKVMQKMMIAFPDKLVNDSNQVLDLVRQVLLDFTASDRVGRDGDDAVSVALSLLNIVLTSPNFRGGQENTNLESIQSSLTAISQMNHQDITTTARNLLLLLKFRATVDKSETTPSTTRTDQQLEERKSYSLALSYLTATDSPPPVRVQGLELISTLIRSNNSILDIPALLVLFSSVLQDEDEYIYLRAIQSFIQLSQRHPRAVTKDLIERYVDSNEDCDLDQRLRLGEALLQVIQNNPLSFTGETAQSVSKGLLFIASRRGYRPKTEKEQQRALKTKQKENAEAEEAWDGDIPQIFDDEINDETKILSEIVSGWESNRGSEDVRIRASALSILGEAMEANIAGLSSNVVAKAIDTSIHILTLELSPSTAIIRRSAILLIMHFVKALDTARSEGKKLGFGFVGQSLADVSRILGYVEETDTDRLVRQHARDVVEGLGAWEMNSLVPSGVQQTELRELAGLQIRPGGGNVDGKMRPRIEEIE